MCLSVIPDGLIYGITFDLEAKAYTTFIFRVTIFAVPHSLA
jgi:hypothetical protein